MFFVLLSTRNKPSEYLQRSWSSSCQTTQTQTSSSHLSAITSQPPCTSPSIFPASFVTVLQIYSVHLWSISSSLHPQQFSVDVTDMNHNLISHFLLSVKCRFLVVRFHRFFSRSGFMLSCKINVKNWLWFLLMSCNPSRRKSFVTVV